MSAECRSTPRLGAAAWMPWIHSLSCDAADCDAERNSHQFSISELPKQGFSNSAQQVCEKGRDEKTLPSMCRNSRVALGELWLPSPGATQPGGTPRRCQGGKSRLALWKCSSSGAPRAVPLCCSEVVGVYLREESSAKHPAFKLCLCSPRKDACSYICVQPPSAGLWAWMGFAGRA